MKTVLVADDTAFVRERFTTALEAAGHRAIAVRTGSELLAALRDDHARIGLIVLDLRLPQAHGLNLLRAIRKIDGRRPAVLVFSGTIASAAEVRELASLGISGYVNEYIAAQHILPSLAPHLFPDEYNRRSSPRVIMGIPVAYRFGNTIAAALTLNISRGGLAVRTTSPLAVGTPVKARFRLPGAKAEIDAAARVSWTDRRIGMGLKFTKVDPATQTILDDFIHSRFFSNRKA